MTWWRGALVGALALAHGAPRADAQAPLLTRLGTLQNPRGVSWHELVSEHFTVIYPDSLDAEAQRALRLLEKAYRPLSASLGKRPRRIPVVLNNQSLTTNGYVAWAPRRSQWYPMPSPSVETFGPVDWYRLLAVHEGRHVVQEQALRTGWVGFFSRLFGDNTMAFLGGSLYFPAWFWEGDAVGMETALTGAGRGRQPQFAARMRALTATDRPYAYYPAWQGTLRTVYPDWYELGYVLTSHVRRHYGDSAWRRVLARASRNPIAPMALSQALKRETGLSLPQLHRAAVDEAAARWRAQRDGVQESAATRVSPAGSGYRAWSLPQEAGDGSVIAAYWDQDTPTQLVRLVDGRREVLVDRIGLVGDLAFHVRGTQVVWSEYEVDPRFGERNYLVVKRLDLATREVKRLSDRSRYVSPVLSPDGAQVAVVSFDLSRAARLALLDAGTGTVVRTLPNAAGGWLATPSWSADGRSLFVVHVDTVRGNALWRVDASSGRAEVVLPYTHDAISRPVEVGGYVVFGSPRDGLDNLWAVDTASGAVSRVTSRKFGAMHGAPADGGRALLFADYGPDGWDVARGSFDPATFTDAAQVPRQAVLLADSVVAQEQRLGAALGDEGEGTRASVAPRPYRGARTAFDFHSLMLAPTSDGVNQGIALESRNLLNTFGVSVGTLFNTNERKFSVDAGASWAATPVILDAGMRWGSRGSTYTDTAGRVVPYSWNERSVQVVARLPLTRLIGQRRQSLVASVGAGITEISDQPVRFRFDNNNGRFTPITWALAASHVRAAAMRDLFQTGASATAIYRHAPGGLGWRSDYTGHLAALRGTAITPGLARNHAVVLDAGHEVQRPGNYRFSSELVFPRGYSRRFHEDLTRVGASYHLPLLYPDLAVGPWLYVRRIQGAAFTDLAWANDRTGTRGVSYRSVGGELTADMAPFGMRTTMRAGVRVAQRLTGDRGLVTEFVFALPQ